MEQRAGRHRSLAAAAGALVQPAAAQHTEGGVAALGADKAAGPTQPGDGVTAGFGAAIASLKLGQAESFLKIECCSFSSPKYPEINKIVCFYSAICVADLYW